jgi:hypothetical protein
MRSFDVNNIIQRTVLDDGQIIQGDASTLNQHQLICYANQLYRNNKPEEARSIMQYQHERFMRHNAPKSVA